MVCHQSMPLNNARRAANRAYYATHTAQAKAARRAWYLKNKAEVIRRAAEWAANNPEKTRAAGKKYRSSHLTEHALRVLRRQALARSLPATLTPAEWSQIQAVFDHRCAYCLEPCDNPERDHVIAVTRGGGFTADNIVPACERCNTRKSNAPVFMMMLNRPRSILRNKRGGC